MMAKTLKTTMVTLAESSDGPVGVASRVLAKYVLGDDTDPAINTVKLTEIGAADLSQPASALYASAVALIKAAEGIL
ncbi:MAG: hypothetical protein V2A73_14450 [Pseudomonadota bacterium]